MKILRATLAALMLLAVLAFPALAQDDGGEDLGDITISVSCTTDPEQVSIANNLDDLPISIVEISSIDDPRENEPFFVGEEVAAGESITFESGSAADENVLTEQFIFDNENLENEGVIVRIGPEPILQNLEVECNQSPETFDITGEPPVQPTKPTVPDNQQDGTDDDQDEVTDDQQDMPDEMPDTGAGVLGGAPLGSGAAAFAVVAMGYALVRRR